MSIGAGIIALAIAGFLAWRGWGEGKWNLGPRITAIFLIAFGFSIAVILWPFGATIDGWLATLATGLVDSTGHHEITPWVATAVQYLPWLSGLAILAIWVVAMVPDKVTSKEKMTWKLAMVGALAPTLLVAAPPGVLAIESTVASAATSVTTSAVAWLSTDHSGPVTTGHGGQVARTGAGQ